MLTAALALAVAAPCAADEEGRPLAADLPYPKVEIITSMGRIVVLLDRPRAPVTVANFIEYLLAGHYEDTIIHRVVPGFVIQGGGYARDFEERPTRDNIVNESGNGLSNARGTIAMARHPEPHTASSQWYINLVDNTRLDPNPARWGYAVFGRVEEGLDVVDAIGALETAAAGPFEQSVPVTEVVVHHVRLLAE